MSLQRTSKLLSYVNYRMRVTVVDGRQIVGRFMAYDKHMNLVLGDAEEFRKLPPKKGKGEEEVRGGGWWWWGVTVRWGVGARRGSMGRRRARLRRAVRSEPSCRPSLHLLLPHISARSAVSWASSCCAARRSCR